MRAPAPDERFILQPWQQTLGSVAILLHLAAIAVGGFMMLSGPWPTPMGEMPFDPPRFAMAGYGVVGPVYAQGLRISTNGRFMTNRPSMQPDIQFEVLLKDEKGNIVKTLTFPDEKANVWVRHRQTILAQWLGNDGMMQPLEAEIVPAPGQALKRHHVWRELSTMSFQGSRWYIRTQGQVSDQSYDMDQLKEMWQKGKLERTQEVSENRVDWDSAEMMLLLFGSSSSSRKLWLMQRDVNALPRGMPLPQPNEWSLLITKAFGRYLCREHGAHSAELIRVSQVAYPPMVLIWGDDQQLPTAPFSKLESYFGKVAP